MTITSKIKFKCIIHGIRTKCQRTKCQKMKNRTKCLRTKCQITRSLKLILNHTLMVVGSLLFLSLSLYTNSLYLPTLTLSLSLSLSLDTYILYLSTYTLSLYLSISLSHSTHSLYLSTHTLSIFISLYTRSLSSFVRDSSYHDMYYKGCGLLCAHKKSFNTAILVRSLGPYMYVNYCTCIVHILV